MEVMKGFGFALEQHLIEEIANAMGYLDLARSERYRNLVILGLDEYAIAKRNSKLRKKKFPINGKKLIPFTVMLPDAINQEIEKVKKSRKQIKRLAIRYLVLIGFDKFKRDNPHPIKEINIDKKVETNAIGNLINNGKPVNFKMDDNIKPLNIDETKETLTTSSPGIITSGENDFRTVPSEFHKNQMDYVIPSGSNDLNIGEKFQVLIELVRELDLKITIEKK